MASRKELFDKLEQLCAMSSAHVITGVRNLLMLIPTDRTVSDVLEVFTHQTPGGASEDPDVALTPQAVLEKYFTPSNISPTKLLYNLEVCNNIICCSEVNLCTTLDWTYWWYIILCYSDEVEHCSRRLEAKHTLEIATGVLAWQIGMAVYT